MACSVKAAGSWGFGLAAIPVSTTTTVTAVFPGMYEWLGIHILTPSSSPYPNTLISPPCWVTGTTYNVTWTGMCTVVIN